jgi:thymidylate kinase
MFVGFIGAPNSGKTTVAAKVFAELKQSGQPDVEFIAEEARRYIAFRKSALHTEPLSNEDQKAIFHKQYELERVMVNAVGEYGTVISDSCAVNSLWYMTPEFRDVFIFENKDYFNWLKENAMLFYTSSIGITSRPDALRIHNAAQSKEIEEVINAELFSRNGHFPTENPWLPLVKVPLRGTIDLKVTKVLEKVYERLTS